MTMHLLPVSPGPSVLPIPTATAPPNLQQQRVLVVQHCSVQRTQSINTGGALAANKSAKAMLGPPDTALLHVCGPPRPGVANRPSSGDCYVVGPGHGQSGERHRGSRGQ
jgi:hypothetical protein